MHIAAMSDRRVAAPEVSAQRVMQRMLAQLRADEVSRDASAKARSIAFELAEQVTFTGILKPLNRSTGCAYVACDDTHTLFGRDVVVSSSQCTRIPVGETVSFRIQIRGGHPQAFDLSWPPVLPPSETPRVFTDPEQVSRPQSASAGRDERRSNMAALLAHDHAQELSRPSTANVDEMGRSGMYDLLSHQDLQPDPYMSDAALSWSSTMRERRDMHALLAHNDGPGRTASDWKPTLEADDRSLVAAMQKHKQDPENHPPPVLREGTFVAWRSN